MKKHEKLAIATVGASWLRNVIVLARACHYGCAAQRDERNGFACTAAMEWRHAAELFAPKTLAAEYCWRQWERIMHLPRRLADPVNVPATEAIALKPPVTRPVLDQISLATA